MLVSGGILLRVLPMLVDSCNDCGSYNEPHTKADIGSLHGVATTTPKTHSANVDLPLAHRTKSASASQTSVPKGTEGRYGNSQNYNSTASAQLNYYTQSTTPLMEDPWLRLPIAGSAMPTSTSDLTLGGPRPSHLAVVSCVGHW